MKDSHLIKTGDNVLAFWFEGIPKAKERPRFSNGHVYTPDATKGSENLIGMIATRCGCRSIPKHVPVSIRIDFYFKVPASASKKTVDNLLFRPCLKRPDIDNLIKTVLDGLNGIAYTDDMYVHKVIASKEWTSSESYTAVHIEW